MSDKDETQTPADKAPPMIAAEAVKRVRRTVVEMVDGRVDGKPAKVPKARQVALNAAEVLPVTRQVICDQLADARLDTYTARSEVTHRIDNTWGLRGAVFFGRNISHRIEQYPTDYNNPLAAVGDGRTIDRYSQRTGGTVNNLAGQFELRGDLDFGGAHHRLLTGLDLGRNKGFNAAFESAPATPFDILAPRYDGRLTGSYVVDSPSTHARTLSRGFYVQDFIEWGERWKLLLGLRHDRLRNDSSTDDGSSPSLSSEESALSPRVGVVYRLSSTTMVFGGWSRSFSSNNGSRSRDGGLFAAERGSQVEVGVKQSLLDQRASITASVFNLVRSNVLTADPVDNNFSVVTGEQRSRGLELDFTGRITPAWNMTAAYTYLDAEVTRDNTIAVGSRLVGAARHSGGLFNKVRLTAWDLPAWSIGAGVVASGNREAQLPNIPVKLGSYTRLDAALYYEQAPWRVQLNVRNLTDRRIYTGQGSALVPQTPRAASLSVAYAF